MNKLKKFQISKDIQKNVIGGNVEKTCPDHMCLSHLTRECVQITRANICVDLNPIE